jgi:hypothetical protein
MRVHVALGQGVNMLAVQAVYGPFAHIRTKGVLARQVPSTHLLYNAPLSIPLHATQVLDMMLRMRREAEGVLENAASAGSSSSSGAGGPAGAAGGPGTSAAGGDRDRDKDSSRGERGRKDASGAPPPVVYVSDPGMADETYHTSQQMNPHIWCRARGSPRDRALHYPRPHGGHHVCNGHAAHV